MDPTTDPIDGSLERLESLYEELDLPAMAKEIERLRELDPDLPEADLWEARLKFHQGDHDAAAHCLDRLTAEFGDDPEVLSWQAIVAEFLGDFDVSDELYERAHAADDSYSRPLRLSEEQAQDLLKNVLNALPQDVRQALANVPIQLQPLPSDKGLDPFLLGLFRGLPFPEEGVQTPAGLPNRIEIYQRNIERDCESEEDLVLQLKITLLHEIGHHLGWDEDELIERGLG